MSYNLWSQEGAGVYSSPGYDANEEFIRSASQSFPTQAELPVSVGEGSDIEYIDDTVSDHGPSDVHAGSSHQPQQYYVQIGNQDMFQTRSLDASMQHAAPDGYDASGGLPSIVVDTDEERNEIAGSSSSSHDANAQAAFMWSSQADFENPAIAMDNFDTACSQLFPEALYLPLPVDQGTHNTGVAMDISNEGFPVEPQDNDRAQQPWVGNDVPDNLLSRGYDTFHIGGPEYASSHSAPRWALRLPTKARPQPSQDQISPALTYGQPYNADHAGPSQVTNGFIDTIPAVWRDVDDQLSQAVRAENDLDPHPQTDLEPAELYARMGLPPDFVLRGDRPNVAPQGDDRTTLHPGRLQYPYNPQYLSAQPAPNTTESATVSTATVFSSSQEFECPECDVIFHGKHGKGNLRRHRKSKHEEKRYPCPYEGCPVAMSRKSYVKKHRLRDHPSDLTTG